VLLHQHKLCQHWSGACPGGPVNSCRSGSRAAAPCSQTLLIWPRNALVLSTCSSQPCRSRHGGPQRCRVLPQVGSCFICDLLRVMNETHKECENKCNTSMQKCALVCIPVSHCRATIFHHYGVVQCSLSQRSHAASCMHPASGCSDIPKLQVGALIFQNY